MSAPFAIPIVAIIMGCSIPIVVMFLDYKKKRAIYELHHRERIAAIDKGLEVPPLPPELFNGGPKSGQPGSYLLKGLIWSAIGVSSYLAVRAIHDSDTAMLGAIPLAIGLAYLLYYALEGRKLSQEPNKDETRPLPKG